MLKNKVVRDNRNMTFLWNKLKTKGYIKNWDIESNNFEGCVWYEFLIYSCLVIEILLKTFSLIKQIT